MATFPTTVEELQQFIDDYVTDTLADKIAQAVVTYMQSYGASVENPAEVPTVETITDDDTTVPFIKRSGGMATGYAQITVPNLATVVASKIDPEEAFPTKMDAITQAQFDAIFYPNYPSDDSSDDDSSDDDSSEDISPEDDSSDDISPEEDSSDDSSE